MKHCLFLCGKKIGKLNTESTLKDIVAQLRENYGLKLSDVYLTCNGKILNVSNLVIDGNVHAEFRCYGGKGGFGSMLRAIGAQIEKTTNREACRDLSGRRLRDINEEKRLKAWLEKQKDRQEDAEEKKRKKLEKLLSVPKHNFKDAEYDSARSDMTEKVSEAVEEGFKKVSEKAAVATISGVKRKADGQTNIKKKKPALWIDDDLGSSTESDSPDNDDEVLEHKSQNMPEIHNSDNLSDENDKETEPPGGEKLEEEGSKSIPDATPGLDKKEAAL